MAEYVLTRTGDTPLKFEGTPLARSSSHRTDGPGQKRWHDLTLYRTTTGKYVLSVSYIDHWLSEPPIETVMVLDTPTAVRDALRLYQPVLPGTGYPAGPAYAQKQARLEIDLRRRFHAAMTDLFEDLDEFTEVIK